MGFSVPSNQDLYTGSSAYRRNLAQRYQTHRFGCDELANGQGPVAGIPVYGGFFGSGTGRPQRWRS
ncbi:hypothetical protein BN970_00071 [Mycolicibacterium conceptionense]|jgi:hypothetical protein|uniref:Uncharacterized protein n=1 Tax=Mycolicibacterium conceptionense TaxID=451644 RepID=A0A0U1CUL5_9MYCO|nr:hypothetical protein BN970_00071 [Mycolicibacterium conceptionense]